MSETVDPVTGEPREETQSEPRPPLNQTAEVPQEAQEAAEKAAQPIDPGQEVRDASDQQAQKMVEHFRREGADEGFKQENRHRLGVHKQPRRDDRPEDYPRPREQAATSPSAKATGFLADGVPEGDTPINMLANSSPNDKTTADPTGSVQVDPNKVPQPNPPDPKDLYPGSSNV
jgi:hypothetical protein